MTAPENYKRSKLAIVGFFSLNTSNIASKQSPKKVIETDLIENDHFLLIPKANKINLLQLFERT